MNAFDLLMGNKQDLLVFLRSRFNLFHESNVFFRDLHYGVMGFLKLNRMSTDYSSAEELTRRVIAVFEESDVLVPIDERTWMLNYLPFKKAPDRPAPGVKPPVKSGTNTALPAQKPVQQVSGPSTTEVSRNISA